MHYIDDFIDSFIHEQDNINKMVDIKILKARVLVMHDDSQHKKQKSRDLDFVDGERIESYKGGNSKKEMEK